MKNKIIFLMLMLFTIASITPQKIAAQASINFQVFYDELSPYGTWIDDPQYGYVWLPNVSADFVPYTTNGHWVLTEDGWTWLSDYSWGWAPFHYGRWFRNDVYGSMWVPDNEWSLAWVTWRRSNDYYGWAPMGPGITIAMAYSSGYNIPYNQWTFIRGRNFGRKNMHNYYINHSNNVTIINNTTIINNIHINKIRNVTYHTGPDRKEVEKHSGKAFAPIVIKESDKPNQNIKDNELHIYRPQVKTNNLEVRKPVPTKVEKLTDAKTTEQRIKETPIKKDNLQNKVQPLQPKVGIQKSEDKKNNPQNIQRKLETEKKLNPNIPQSRKQKKVPIKPIQPTPQPEIPKRINVPRTNEPLKQNVPPKQEPKINIPKSREQEKVPIKPMQPVPQPIKVEPQKNKQPSQPKQQQNRLPDRQPPQQINPPPHEEEEQSERQEPEQNRGKG